MVSLYQLFYSWRAAFVKAQVCLFWKCSKSQYWRVVTTFLYMGPLNLDFIFHIFFMYSSTPIATNGRARYSRMLEETHFRNRTKAFVGLLIYAMIILLLMSPLTSLPFLGSPLSFSLVYIYSRLNPDVRMSFLGLFIFRAPYLPWVLLGFSLLLNSQVPVGDLMGIAVGHGYYFYEICRRDGDGDFWRGVRGLRRQMGTRLAT